MSVTSSAQSARSQCIVTGTVWHKADVALPADAILTVRLQEQGIADKAAEQLAIYTAPIKGQKFPLPFKMTASCGALKAASMPGFNVRIELAGKLLFVTDTIHTYQPGKKDHTVEVVPVTHYE